MDKALLIIHNQLNLIKGKMSKVLPRKESFNKENQDRTSLNIKQAARVGSIAAEEIIALTNIARKYSKEETSLIIQRRKSSIFCDEDEQDNNLIHVKRMRKPKNGATFEMKLHSVEC